MCWSGEASAVLAAAGIASTIYAAWKKEPIVLWMSLGYFSGMELLQAFTYSVIGQCDNPSNQIATLLGYLHIAFQPFFINAVSLYFIAPAIAKRVAPLAYSVCFFSVIFMLIQLYPFAWAGLCDPARPLCGEQLCSFRGEWHIAWSLPTNGIGNSFVDSPIRFLTDGYPTYVLAGFLLPLLYGSWRFTVYHAILGPLLAATTTSNVNEWPAVWCLLSIGLLMIVVKTPMRKILHGPGWWLPEFKR